MQFQILLLKRNIIIISRAQISPYNLNEEFRSLTFLENPEFVFLSNVSLNPERACLSVMSAMPPIVPYYAVLATLISSNLITKDCWASGARNYSFYKFCKL